MKGQHSYIDYVKDTLEAIEKATVFVEGMSYEEFTVMIKRFMQSSGL